MITTIAGTDTNGFSGDGGPATSAQLNTPRSVAVDADGNVYISDYINSRVRKVTPAGTIFTVAGNGQFSYTGDGGDAGKAALNLPLGLATAPGGKLVYRRQQQPCHPVNPTFGFRWAAGDQR